MTAPVDAVVAGHICLDIIPDLSKTEQGAFERLFAPGRLLEIGTATFAMGGVVPNTGLALSKLGIRTQLMGKIGDDLFGGAIKEAVSAWGTHLGDGMIVDPDSSTSYTLVINPPQSDRMFMHFSGPNDTFKADDIDYDRVGTARLFHFGYPPIMRLLYQNNGAELVEIFRRARATGVTTSLDMSLPDPSSPGGRADWSAILAAVLPYVDIFMPSAEEILYMLRRQTFDRLHQAVSGGDVLALFTPDLVAELAGELLAMGVRIAGLKLGPSGFYMQTASETILADMGRAMPSAPATWARRQLWAPAFQVTEVGTTGAGDAAYAGFLTALLRDVSPEEALTMAVAVGACNIEAADSLSGIRSWEETGQRVAGHWPRRPLTINAPGWQFDAQHQLWVAGR